MKYLALIIFFYSYQVFGSSLVYGVESSDNHDFIKLNFDSRVLHRLNGFLLSKKNQQNYVLGEISLNNSKEFMELYSLLPKAFKKSKELRGRIPSHKPYLLFKKRILTSNSPEFYKIITLIEKVLAQSRSLKEGIYVERQKSDFKITSFNKSTAQKPLTIKQKFACKNINMKKGICRFKQYSWPQ